MIRKLQFDDYNKNFGKLFQVLSPSTEELSYETFVEFFHRHAHDNITFVMEEKNNIIATGKVFFEYKYARGGCVCAHIEDVIVHPDHQNKKLGRKMVEHLIEIAKQNEKVYKIILNCSEHNVAFYEKFGFRKTDKSPFCLSLYF
jgi:glucosamine-phosphate N-acetyltransferase